MLKAILHYKLQLLARKNLSVASVSVTLFNQPYWSGHKFSLTIAYEMSRTTDFSRISYWSGHDVYFSWGLGWLDERIWLLFEGGHPSKY